MRVNMFQRALLIGLSVIFAHAQQKDLPARYLTLEHLQNAGLRIPARFKTLKDIDNYLQSNAYHQEIVVEWDSLPGISGQVPMKNVEALPLSTQFTLKSRTGYIAGRFGIGNDEMTQDYIIIAAVNAANEILALRDQRDGRNSHAEILDPGKQQRFDFVNPKVQLTILLPDDPAIKTLLFFKFKWTSGATGWAGHLEQVGKLDLPSTQK